jgi:hypothetical protein
LVSTAKLIAGEAPKILRVLEGWKRKGWIEGEVQAC